MLGPARSTSYFIATVLVFITSLASVTADASSDEKPFRVAIIGAGIGGCASAYYLKYPDGHGDSDGRTVLPSLPIDVTIYDAQAKGPGGRVQSRDFPIAGSDDSEGDGDATMGIDLGASIFIRDNQRVYNLSQHFNLPLTRKPMSDGRLSASSGLWDGKEFIWMLGDRPWYDPSRWWQRIQLGWRYGFRTMGQMSTIVQQFVDRFSEVYTPSMPKWRSIYELAERLNMTELLQQTAHEYLVEKEGLNALFVEEMVNAATRVNYGIDVNHIHALAGLVSLAPIVSDTMGIKGGNQLLVRELCKRSATQGHFGKRVVSLIPSVEINGSEQCQLFVEQNKERLIKGQHHEHQLPIGCRPRWQVTTETGDQDTFHAVILAAPLDQVKFNKDSYPFDVAPVKYKQLHVTIARGHLNKAYFGLDKAEDIPTSIMTHAQGNPHFISLTQIGVSPPLPYRINKQQQQQQQQQEPLVETESNQSSNNNTTDNTTPVLIKLFSNTRLDSDVLFDLFNYHDTTTVRHKLFHSYPLMTPENAKVDRRTEIAPGVWYVNGMEPFISTMETETVSAVNAVRLVRDWATRILTVHKNTSD